MNGYVYGNKRRDGCDGIGSLLVVVVLTVT